MKKHFIIIVIICTLLYSCKKEPNTVSTVVDVSYPTVSFPNGQFFSIPVGGTIPNVKMVAYDSSLNQTADLIDTDMVDNTAPGLNVLWGYAKNGNGYTSTAAAFVAVTDISSSIDLSGLYVRAATNDTFRIDKIANGLYQTNDVGGAPTLPIVAYFAQLDDTTLTLPPQPTDAGTLYATGAKVSMVPGDTTIQWRVSNVYFGTYVRTFIKI